MRLVSKLRSAWYQFSDWFDTKPVQIVYSVLVFGLGLWIYLNDNIIALIFGVLLMVAGLINLLAVLILPRSPK